MSGTKRLKRRRGRPVAMPDYLLVLFEIVEVEQYRTGLSINRVWQRIIKQAAAHYGCSNSQPARGS